MFAGSVNQEYYNDCMNGLSKMAQELNKVYASKEYMAGMKKQKLYRITHADSVSATIKNVYDAIRGKINLIKLRKRIIPFKREDIQLSAANYFSEERIAVYTCVFGNYDKVIEPMCHPNNIDYYIITDSDVPRNSSWKKVDINPFESIIEGLSNVEKNRWFKMHPAAAFKDYEYSIYIDGNVVPVTDFTEFINRMGKCGIAMFWHRYNNCVYQEALYNRYVVRKIDDIKLRKHVKYLKGNGMPENYGMTTCNVIARQHNNALCDAIMNDWWAEFMSHCRRDQMSFPYVVWKNNVNMSDIANLGSDVWDSSALFVSTHID